MSAELPLIENLRDAPGPADLAARFLDLPFVLLLDSATGATTRSEVHPLGRYSFLSADPAVVLRSRNGMTETGAPGGRVTTVASSSTIGL